MPAVDNRGSKYPAKKKKRREENELLMPAVDNRASKYPANLGISLYP